ncbi:hypothetical protein Ddye_022752 [Dipteronia dyeriana]|uniref:Uncharacterized protein n=1 Tax=Dipteronia dyeriana TaxID=168575 RepID=A0AAD9TRN2_9ROSI|nr:hypothetical protein Ddye_022752 [Dipteronia dyeriana]
MAAWKSASLSLAGRCTLIKFVTSVLPTYAMLSIKLHTEVWHTLDKINRDFLWGSNLDKRKIHLVKWDTMCLPKKLGGLGIRKMKWMNQICSSTLRGLSFGAKLISNGIHWRVGNRQNVNFWTDVWIPVLGTLQNYASCILSDDQINEKVCDYLRASNWNLQKLSSVLPCGVVNRIFSLHINNNCNIEDSIIWGLYKNEDFPVSSAYDSLLYKDVVDVGK